MMPKLQYIKAKYLGIQQWPDKVQQPTLILYNLEEDIPGHPVGSTVSLQTMMKKGYHPKEV